ncbi:MAG: carbohydrate ABC transporter permease [Clostridia bacterium]|nr:carbohydrate ABC transporter permease [Clostridia bacterium]
MNAQNTERKSTIVKESKNKIRADFDRSPLKDRIKARFLNFYFLQKVVIWIVRMILMIGISYIVLYPFLTQIAASFMAPEDFVDTTVRLIPKNFSLDIYRAIITDFGYFQAFGNTFLLSFGCALLQMMVCSFIGYGFAKFKFRGRNLIFMLVMLTMIIPHPTLRSAMYTQFRNFDVLGIVRLLRGGGIQIFGWNIKDMGEGVAAFFEGLNVLPETITLGTDDLGLPILMQIKQTGLDLSNTYWPLILLSMTGLAFKNGLYIFLLRQFFRGIPDELEESAYMDGCGTFHTFFRIILPLSIPMMITVFLFAFCWQWTDDFYINLINVGKEKDADRVLVQLVTAGGDPESLQQAITGDKSGLYKVAIRNTTSLMLIAPLVVLYAFCQKFLVQGIEHSGIAN